MDNMLFQNKHEFEESELRLQFTDSNVQFCDFHIFGRKEKRDTNLNRNRYHQKFYSHLKFYFK